MSAERSAAAFAAALIELERELDWELLGRLYCHEGGEHFFPPAQRQAIREAGLLFADDVASAVGKLPAGSCASSLYLGAGIAELAPALCEFLVLGREVRLVTLAGAEADELNRALGAVSETLDVALPRVDTTPLAAIAARFDHLWLVSVLSDPETFPALSAELYGRPAPAAGDAPAERRRAAALVDEVLARAEVPAVLTTTDEELELVRAGCGGAGLALEVPAGARFSAVVGDPVRTCGLARA